MTVLDTTARASDDIARVAERAMRAGSDHLLSLQSEKGWWKGELETNVTMDAEDLLLRHFLGILDAGVAKRSATWIRRNRSSDGTWATFYGGPPDLSTTVEAYVALRLAGEDPGDPEMVKTAEWVRAKGGVGATRVFTRIWLSLVGRWSWEDLPVVPAEIMFLPARFPLNIYDFGCWARQTIVPLTVLMSVRPVRALPFTLDELFAGEPKQAKKLDLRSTAGRFDALDRILHRYERLPQWFAPRRLLRAAAIRRAEEWIVRRQEADGLWGGIQPPVVYSVMALHVLGYPLDHPVLRAALEGIDGFTIEDDKGRRIEACQSPVWDTALALLALSDAGVDSSEPSMRSAVEWMLAEEVRVRGDWAVRRPALGPGGWAFEFANDNYPDIDDTAEVVLALRAAAAGSPGLEGACRRAVAWTVGMQSRSGGWAAFDADNDSRLVASLPFCDFGEVTDPPSADVTAHVLEMLAREPGVAPEVISSGLSWLSAHQEEDGSWFGRWGVNHVYGTGAAVPALVAAGVSTDDERVRRAVAWLLRCQNADGGWGEDLRSYIDPTWRGRGFSTPSQTAWALLALLAAGERDSQAVQQGIRWMAGNQLADGSWDEPWFTGTGFPWDFSINYHLYRQVWPVTALGRYVRGGPS